jgi:hypothetical protein
MDKPKVVKQAELKMLLKLVADRNEISISSLREFCNDILCLLDEYEQLKQNNHA